MATKTSFHIQILKDNVFIYKTPLTGLNDLKDILDGIDIMETHYPVSKGYEHSLYLHKQQTIAIDIDDHVLIQAGLFIKD